MLNGGVRIDGLRLARVFAAVAVRKGNPRFLRRRRSARYAAVPIDADQGLAARLFSARRRRGFGLLRAYRRGFNARPRDRLNNFLVNQWFKWWSQGESNPRPLECHSSALPTELWPRPSNGVPRRGRFDLDCDPQTFLMSYSGCQWPGLQSSADTARRATGCCGSTADLKSQIRDRLKSPHHPPGHRR